MSNVEEDSNFEHSGHTPLVGRSARMADAAATANPSNQPVCQMLLSEKSRLQLRTCM